MRGLIATVLLLTALSGRSAQTNDPVGTAVGTYFSALFEKLGDVAAQKPTHDTFRAAMKPAAESIDGFFGGSLITPDFVIDQSYYKIHALANGYDLKNVRQLDYFRNIMNTAPAPQLSEPGRGSLLQPHLIALRYPFFTDGRLTGIVSMMIRTENFLTATGLDHCRAYKIICRGEPAEEKGTLSGSFREVTVALPSTEWTIQYDP